MSPKLSDKIWGNPEPELRKKIEAVIAAGEDSYPQWRKPLSNDKTKKNIEQRVSNQLLPPHFPGIVNNVLTPKSFEPWGKEIPDQKKKYLTFEERLDQYSD